MCMYVCKYIYVHIDTHTHTHVLYIYTVHTYIYICGCVWKKINFIIRFITMFNITFTNYYFFLLQ